MRRGGNFFARGAAIARGELGEKCSLDDGPAAKNFPDRVGISEPARKAINFNAVLLETGNIKWI